LVTGPASNDVNLNGLFEVCIHPLQLSSMTSLSRLLLLAILLGVFSFIAILHTGLPTATISQRFQSTKSTQASSCEAQASQIPKPEWDPSLLVKGAPTRFFRGLWLSCFDTLLLIRRTDNLLEDRGYITSWTIAGFSGYILSNL